MTNDIQNNISSDENLERFRDFAINEAERKSITIIIHSCSKCGNGFDFPLVLTVLDNGTATKNNGGPTEDDIPAVVGGCCYN